jgi:hypothetical protein
MADNLRNHVVCGAQDFLEMQKEHQAHVEQALAEFHAHSLATVESACTADLQRLEERLQVHIMPATALQTNFALIFPLLDG